MSVLVKGMEMPESCHECDLKDVALDYELSYICPFCGEVSPAGRAFDCPLVEIPTPHGRLIDADDFDSRIRAAGGMADEELTDDFKDGVLTVLALMETQNTVIEAED